MLGLLDVGVTFSDNGLVMGFFGREFLACFAQRGLACGADLSDFVLCLLTGLGSLSEGFFSEGVGFFTVTLGCGGAVFGGSGAAFGGGRTPLGLGDLRERFAVRIFDLGSRGFDVAGGADLREHVVEVLHEVGKTLGQFGKALVERGPRHRYRRCGRGVLNGDWGLLSAGSPGGGSVVHGPARIGLFAVSRRATGRGVRAPWTAAAGVGAEVAGGSGRGAKLAHNSSIRVSSTPGACVTKRNVTVCDESSAREMRRGATAAAGGPLVGAGACDRAAACGCGFGAVEIEGGVG